jgi:molybdopterin synthase catalytic subunit
MTVDVRIVDGPLAPAGSAEPAPGAGAVVVFEGIVREREGDLIISALDYTSYDPMALGQLRALAEDIVKRHGLIALHAEHSRGRVPVGACSFRLTIHAAHRKEALAAMDGFIDRLKRDVPVWKAPVAQVSPPSASPQRPRT